jgi:hypothetical protein
MKRLCGLIAVAAFVAVGCTKATEPAAPAAAAFTPTPHGTLLPGHARHPVPRVEHHFRHAVERPRQAGQNGRHQRQLRRRSTAAFAAYAGWNAVENAAVAIQETANLIMIPGRKCGNGQPVPNDQEDFKKWASELAVLPPEVQKFARPKPITRIRRSTWPESCPTPARTAT